MEQDLSLATTHLSGIASAPANLSSEDMLDRKCATINSDGRLRVAYAPFDHISLKARLVIVGITPGRTQAVNAIKAARLGLARGCSLPQTLAEAKLTGSFSGPLRANLIAMLDAIGVAGYLGLQSTEEVFSPSSADVHFTSALRYPVFVDGKNYNGAPNMLQTPLLREMVDTYLAEEARILRHALWLPLGPRPDAALQYLASRGVLDQKQILSGLPHPSGANAERVAVFLGRKAPEEASRQTKPMQLLEAFERLSMQISDLQGGKA